MKKRSIIAALGLLAFASPVAGEIALVDMAEVLKQHDRFTLEMADLKVRTQEIANAFKEQSRELQLLKQELESKPDGSEEQIRLKAQMERKVVDLKASMDEQKRRLQQEEAELYADAYEEVIAVIHRVAKEQNIDLVLRYQLVEEVDRSSTKTVLSHLNRSVLYHRDLDITDTVIARLQADAAKR